MTLEYLNKNYIYQGDNPLDIWQEMQPNKDGKYLGDCEDYAITIKKNVSEFKDWDYYYCKLNGIGHCILYKNGDIIDCNTKSVVTFENYCKIYKVTEFKKYNWFVVFSKILFSNMYLFYRKIRGV